MLLDLLARFRRHTSGNLPLLAALLLIPMTLIGGGAIDFMQHEAIRLTLQDALDRGTLAASSLNQTQESKPLIMSFLKRVPGGDKADLTITESRQVNARKVSADAKVTYSPAFLTLAGISTLDVVASSTAEEARQKIEMSVVLDISGSMYDNGGMVQLKPAAKNFLDIVLKPELQPVTSVSIIPFAGTVNMGAGVFDYFAATQDPKSTTPAVGTRIHSYSSCFDMEASDFASAALSPFASRRQLQHFTYYNYNSTGKQPWWCPTEEASISYLSNDITYLKARVDALRPFDGTGTAFGMKWAEMLLNPAFQPAIKAIGSGGLAPIPTAFQSRPAPFSDKETMKFIVLMTDGQIGFQPRPATWALPLAVTNKNISGSADNKVLYSQAQAEAFYKQVCTYTKAEGITVFTIAFKVSAAVAASIATCASNPSYAYKVDGLDMASAFQSIATTMQRIRLVD